MELNYRRTAVFDLPVSYDPAAGKILDIRINWIAPAKDSDFSAAELAARAGLAAGQTLLYSAPADDATPETIGRQPLVFIAKHPTQNNTYYRLAVRLNVSYSAYVPYITAAMIYTVAGTPYYVRAAEIYPSVFSISSADAYLLIDMSAAVWYAGQPIEPFNTVFFPLTNPESVVVPRIKDAYAGITSGAIVTTFTNTPIALSEDPETGDTVSSMLPVQYALTVQDGGLILSKSRNVALTTSANIIRSINGVTAQGGNINIKVLENG